MSCEVATSTAGLNVTLLSVFRISILLPGLDVRADLGIYLCIQFSLWQCNLTVRAPDCTRALMNMQFGIFLRSRLYTLEQLGGSLTQVKVRVRLLEAQLVRPRSPEDQPGD